VARCRLHGGANARALLAFESPEFLEEVPRHGPLKPFTKKSVTSRAGLIKELEQIRRDGYAISDEDMIPHISSIGAPVFGYRRQILASIFRSAVPRPAILGDNRERTSPWSPRRRPRCSRALGLDESDTQPASSAR